MPIMRSGNKPSSKLFAWKVELGSKAGALKQMLLDILEDSQEIRRLCIVGRNCILSRNSDMECAVPLEKQIAEGNYVGYLEILLLNIVTHVDFIICRRGGRD